MFRSTSYLFWASTVVLCTCVSGTLAYMIFESVGFVDAFYMALNVVSTLGMTRPETTQAGRFVTMVLIIVGTGGVAFLVSAVASAIVAREIKTVLGKRNMKTEIDKIKNHVIVCGYGRMGRQVCEDFTKLKCRFVIVDNNQASLEIADKAGFPYVNGHAHDEEVLKLAGIDRARGLVSVLTTDADNIYVVLTARGLNPSLHIVVRTEDDATVPKMKRAGANVVVSPFTSGAKQISLIMINPAIAEFFDEATQGENLEITELVVPVGGCLVGMVLGKTELREKCEVIVVSAKRKGGRQIVAPSGEYEIEEGDRLLCIGAKGARERIENVMATLKSEMDASHIDVA